jgi:hypothetical protein
MALGTEKGAEQGSPQVSPEGAAANAQRVAVLLTDWAEPEGFDPLYRREVVKRSFSNRAESPDEPCTENYVGKDPYRVQLGLTPYALGSPVKGFEGAYDSMGLYRLSADGQTYVSIYDEKVTVAASAVPATPGMITPAKDVKKPLQRSLWAIDPRDGTNYLEGVVMIGSAPMGPGPNPLAFPNGIRDADEYSWAGAITDFSVLHDDLTPRLSPATVEVESTTARVLKELFGDQVDVRFGAYAPTTGLTRFEEDVALDFHREGFRRMVLVRETTDNNNYANNFMTRGYIERALCKAGHKDEIQFQQSRQVGPHARIQPRAAARGEEESRQHQDRQRSRDPLHHLRTAVPGPQFARTVLGAASVVEGGLSRERVQQLHLVQTLPRGLLQQSLHAAVQPERRERRQASRQLLFLRSLRCRGFHGEGAREPLPHAAREHRPGEEGRTQEHPRRALALVLQRPRSAARGARDAEDPAEHAHRFPQWQVLGGLVRENGQPRSRALRRERSRRALSAVLGNLRQLGARVRHRLCAERAQRRRAVRRVSDSARTWRSWRAAPWIAKAVAASR